LSFSFILFYSRGDFETRIDVAKFLKSKKILFIISLLSFWIILNNSFECLFGSDCLQHPIAGTISSCSIWGFFKN
jgi:hypothetical protein